MANALQANILAATAEESSKNEVYNVAFGQRTTLNELFGILKKDLSQNEIDYSLEPLYRDFRSGDVRHSLADIGKATTLLGYVPQYNIRSGIAEAMPWYIQFIDGAQGGGQ